MFLAHIIFVGGFLWTTESYGEKQSSGRLESIKLNQKMATYAQTTDLITDAHELVHRI